LDDESLSGIIVSFSLSSSLEFGLESHEISFVLNDFNEGHFVVVKINIILNKKIKYFIYNKIVEY
jgi:hypothetical protein